LSLTASRSCSVLIAAALWLRSTGKAAARPENLARLDVDPKK
jgi:hypothetical protein